MPVALGGAARELRTKLGLSLREAASALGVSYVHLCNIENGKSSVSQELIEKFHDTWGIDLYMYALAFYPDDRKTPKAARAAIKSLAQVWKQHIESLLSERATEGASCLISAD